MRNEPIQNENSALNALHRRRIRWMLWIGAALLVALGLGWSIFFALIGEWIIVAMDVTMLVLGLAVAALTYQKRTRFAFFLLAGSMFLVICGVSILFDVPSAQAPRSTHHFLLVVAVCSLLFLRDDRSVLRYTVTGAYMLAFVVLGSTNSDFGSPYALADSVRVTGTWVNNLFSALGLYALIHIMVAELTEQSSLAVDLRKAITHREFFCCTNPR
jgi:hypothetical protein